MGSGAGATAVMPATARRNRNTGKKEIPMTRLVVLIAIAAPLMACDLQPDPPPEVQLSAYGGMGDRMGQCMKYASESYCLKQTWGGDDFGN